MNGYTSPRGWYRLSYPKDWTMGVEDDKNAIFYEPEGGVGTLRITAIKAEGSPPFQAHEFLEQHRTKHNGAWVNLGDMPAVYYLDESIEDAEKVVSHHWIVGKGRLVVAATFSLPGRTSISSKAQQELELTRQTLRSMILMPE